MRSTQSDDIYDAVRVKGLIAKFEEEIRKQEVAANFIKTVRTVLKESHAVNKKVLTYLNFIRIYKFSNSYHIISTFVFRDILVTRFQRTYRFTR